MRSATTRCSPRPSRARRRGRPGDVPPSAPWRATSTSRNCEAGQRHLPELRTHDRSATASTGSNSTELARTDVARLAARGAQLSWRASEPQPHFARRRPVVPVEPGRARHRAARPAWPTPPTRASSTSPASPSGPRRSRARRTSSAGAKSQTSPRSSSATRMPRSRARSDLRETQTVARFSARCGTTTQHPAHWYELTGAQVVLLGATGRRLLHAAKVDGGVTCFFLPRTLPTATFNRFFVQRLKDKAGNRSNASSEVEFAGTLAIRVGEEGRGIRESPGPLAPDAAGLRSRLGRPDAAGAHAGPAAHDHAPRLPHADRRAADDGRGAGRHGGRGRGGDR